MRRILTVKTILAFSLAMFAGVAAFSQKAPPKPADRLPVDSLVDRALVEEKIGRYEMAEDLLKDAMDKARALFGKDSLVFFEQMDKLADFYVRHEMYIEASDLLGDAISLREKGKAPILPPGLIIADLSLYGISLYGIGDEENAEPMLKKASTLARDLLRPERRPYRTMLKPVVQSMVRAERALIKLLEGQGRDDEAGVLRSGLEDFMKNLDYLP